ncbi:hypothetical protein WICANDRAFT_76881 [Wickerhamomyces anomalus NRRL Y-366-8]|uniref:Damage-regulated import facilitator 1 n=1 Tax=Wickerhamomyces anomalus (strain ATCC 58044 / CBS 1984 / NCYC 433 / NRRL Y-366-8) TaxID=683960 RepID=A0A1E3PCL9_WICAA|nr:uncharacterized protein WICANDRAFT_76881 [Wickerhamomyces anomalus NRRL Y-366-8]ODQ62712.1 hypothetical protein WICANDRAFT_76881 [Wickerhamomyces anomalus NRRL Y-366-8]
MSQVKRQLNHNLSQQSGEAYPHQYDLQTIGMRIRKAVSDGYQTSNNTFPQEPRQQEQQQQQFPPFQRVPLPSNVVVPPLLSNATSSSFGSSFEEWENNLDVRLNNIENVLTTNKEALSKRRFECVDNDW